MVSVIFSNQTTANLSVDNNETYAEMEQNEPLGQKITLLAPPTEGLQSYGAYRGNVAEPEWQCQASPDFYGSFSALPWHCQREAMRNAGSKTPYENEGLEKPTNIPFKHPERSPTEPPATQDGLNRLMKFTLLSTSKRMDDNESGSAGEGDDDHEPIRISTWEWDDSIPGFNNASFGTDYSYYFSEGGGFRKNEMKIVEQSITDAKDLLEKCGDKLVKEFKKRKVELDIKRVLAILNNLKTKPEGSEDADGNFSIFNSSNTKFATKANGI